jgi:hypothetical protein
VGRLEREHKKSHLSLPEARRALKGMEVSSPEAPGNTDKAGPTVAQPVILALALPQADPGAPAPSPSETAIATARSLFNQGAAMGVPYMLSTGEEYARGRRESVVPMLKALKILVDNGAPPEEAQPDLPAVSGFRVLRIMRTEPGGQPQLLVTPVDPALVKKYEEQIEARRKAEVLLDAWGLRRGITFNIAGYYMQPPYATDELRQLATDILQDETLVNALVQKAEANIPKIPPPPPIQQPVTVALALPQADPGAPAPSSLETAMASARSLFNQAALMGVPYMLSTGEEYARGRRESVVPMLKALKILVQSGAPSEEDEPWLPAVSPVFVIPADSPEHAAALKRYAEQWEARRKAEVLLDAWSLRWIIAHNIAGYYMQPPYATDELRQLATDILKDQALVNTLVQKAEANIPSPPPPAPVQQPVPVKQAIRRQN